MPKSFESVSLILPTYNERGNVGPLLEALERVFRDAGIGRWQVIVVDDDSRDGTRELVKAAQEREPRIELHVRKGARGLATAVRHGLERASGQVLVMMDSDYNHDPVDLPRFFAKLEEGHEVVVGSRYVEGGFMESSVLRHYLSKWFNMFACAVLGLKTKDNLSGFIAMRREVLQGVDMDRVFVGFGEFHMPLIFLFQKAGRRIVEVPVIYGERQYGKSKFHPVKNLVNYTRIIFRIRSAWGRCA
jgi:dolichol-phosphate mannosyltransferase